MLSPIIEGCVSQPNSPENWKRLFAISKCVLRASNRGGKKHKQQQDRLMLTRFERWKNGDYAGLWFEAASMKQAKKINHDSMETLAARAKSLCLQGQFGRAAKILSSDGVAPDNKETLKELMNLHPAEEVPPRVTDDYSCYAYQFDEASVFKQLQSFSNFTAAGQSKMYPEHLLHAVACAVPDQSKKSITSITKLVNLASRGQLPSFVEPTFCSASLTALKKTKGGVRPIAVGEVFRRLIAKCFAQEASSEAVELFSSRQLGVAVKCGAESIVHATKQTFQKLLNNEKAGLLQIDFKNAFNSITRSSVLDAARKFIPSLAPFASFCYSQHSKLFFNATHIQSESGVQQGDPLGPLLFSLGL